MSTLRQIRKRRGLTQVQLGKLAGIDQAQISQLERADDPNVGWHLVRKLARALKAKPHELFTLLPGERG